MGLRGPSERDMEAPTHLHDRWAMHATESRAVLRASSILLLISIVRWATPTRTEPPGAIPGPDVLEELTDSTRRAATEAERRARPLSFGERIDINRASASELDRLPGIGPATAAAVVAARDSGTVFRVAEDLAAVRGIGPSLVDRVRDHVDTPDPPPAQRTRSSRRVAPGEATMVDVNEASLQRLQTLPGVGPVIAARIVAGRPFATVADLERVKGLGPAAMGRLRGLVSVGRGR